MNAPHAQRQNDAVATMALGGLLAARKTLPPLLFYDEEGCRLFYEITRLPEYYLTRTEMTLLTRIAPALAAAMPPGAALVEYGASDETKAALLLSQTIGFAEPVFRTYVPIDVATPSLWALKDRLAARFPGLAVHPHTADFMRPVTLPARPDGPVLGFFPGSTIGNLEPEEAVGFLHRARDTLGPDARLIVGFDCCQDPARLIPAYDDPAGVTAAFNRNLLTRLNREAGARFEPDVFAHRAIWNEAEGRIEMHLISPRALEVQVAGRVVRFAAGESIHTENSYKYRPDRMQTLADAAGWTPERTWTDPMGLFAIWMLR
jgi:L-histidine Nalpha-methyltransferase